VQINDDDDDDDDETVIDVGLPFSDSLKLSDAAANPAAFSNVWSAPPWKAYSGAVLPQQTLLYLRAASNSPCYSPRVASPARKPTGEA